MQRAHPEEYNFVPQTWVLPAEYPLKIILKLFSQCNDNNNYIIVIVIYEPKLYKIHICKTPILKRCEITFSKDKRL